MIKSFRCVDTQAEKQAEWNRLFLDHNTGRVWIDRNGTKELYRENTYISVQILRNSGSEDVSLGQNIYGDFRDALERDSTSKAARIQESLGPALDALALKRVQIRAFNQAQKTFEEMVAACEAKPKQEAAWRGAAFDMLTQTQKAVRDLKCPSKDVGGGNEAGEDGPSGERKSDLSVEQLQYLLQRMRERSGAVTAEQLQVYKLDCEHFPNMEFETFATAMCRE